MAPVETGSRSQYSMNARAAEERRERPSYVARDPPVNNEMSTSVNEDNYRGSNVHLTQTADMSAYSADKTMEAIDRIMLEYIHTPQLCPWHSQQVTHSNQHMTSLHPMRRYMAEGAADQSSVYFGVQRGTLSITKGCTCAAVLSNAVNSTSNFSSAEQRYQSQQGNGQSHG